MKRVIDFVRRGAFLALLVLAPLSAFASPVVLYTDLVSGPNTGGEGNNGCYLSIFGRGFGASLSNVKVLIGNTEVADYKYLGPTLGRPDLQQLTVQPGSAVGTGAIQVVVDGEGSNTEHNFEVVPGDIFFVSLDGDDSTGVVGDISRPFRHAKSMLNRPEFGPGDQIVVRGGTYFDNDNGGFIRLDKSGVDDNGNLIAYCALMGYPGERALLQGQGDGGGEIYFYQGDGGWVVSSLLVNSAGSSCFSFSKYKYHIRAVNLDLTGLWGSGGGTGAVKGGGKYISILGCSIHDNGRTKLYHGIYISDSGNLGTQFIDIGWNHIYNQTGGRGIMCFTPGGYEGNSVSDVLIHDNIVHNIALTGIGFSGKTLSGKIYNNLVYDCAKDTSVSTAGGIGIHAHVDAEIFNNTVYDCGGHGVLDLKDFNSLKYYNNLGVSMPGQNFYRIETPPEANNNLWFGSDQQSIPSWGTNWINEDPLLVDVSKKIFQLQPNSPAIDAGVTSVATKDMTGIPRPQGAGVDIGANEYCDGSSCSFEVVVDTVPPAPPGNLRVVTE